MRRAPLVALVALVAVAGCYSPQINDGDFQCVAPQNLCPSGFACVAGHCYRSSTQLDLSAGTFAGTGLGGALTLDDTATGSLTFNPDTGEVRFTPSGGTAMVMVMAGQPGFDRLTQPSGGPTIGLWSFTTVSIPAGVTVTPAGTGNALFGLAATDTMTVRGTIDWRGFGGVGGLPRMAGGSRSSGVSSGGGGASDDPSGSGGGGAGYASDGMAGGGTSPGSGGAHYGSADLTPVHAGSGGGGGAGPSGALPGGGGLGGGGVVLVGHTITIGGTIDISGNPGKSADASSTAAAGGGGGGSGGSLLISADTLTLEASHSLRARGGTHGNGAAGGGRGGDGADGRIAVDYGKLMFTGAATTIVAMPDATKSPAPLTTFPR